MSRPNNPYDDFPDLSLPDRADPPQSPLQPLSVVPKEISQARSTGWREGDRVLAPWEAHFLYFGVIEQIENGQAHIAFGDGDAGWVFVEQIRPISLSPGQQVFCRPQPGHLHLPAEILDVAGERVHVSFENGDDWTSLSALRIPTNPAGPDAVVTRAASHLAFAKNLMPGTRVWAHWGAGALFVGTVRAANAQEAHIQFDDGDAGWVKLDQLLPLMLVEGMRVLGRWKMGMHYFPGTISEIKNGRVFIRYDDGDKEWTTTAALMIPGNQQGPNARVTRNANNGGSRGASGWMIWIAVVVGIFLLRLFLAG
jgi:hypothetical protein